MLGIFHRSKWAKGTFGRSLIYHDALLICDVLAQPKMWAYGHPIRRDFLTDQDLKKLCNLRDIIRRTEAINMLLAAKIIESNYTPNEIEIFILEHKQFEPSYKLTDIGCNWYADQHLKSHDSMSKLYYFILGIVAAFFLK